MQYDNVFKIFLYKLGLIIPDSIFVRLKYHKAFGQWPDLKNPKTFNEKLSWLKLHDRNPLYTRMVDKYEAKKYVAEIIGEEFIIPTYNVWNSVNEIDFDSLPDKFVMKATHDSGRVIICHDKSKLDKRKAKTEMHKSLKRDFYAVTREWPYKNVKPKIITELLLEHSNIGSSENLDINDYKFFCFNGNVEFLKIDFDRSTNHRANYYDREFNLLDFGEEEYPPDFARKILKPEKLKLMIYLAEKIACNTRFVRVDFYEIDGKVYFGEITFYPASAVGRFMPLDADRRIGNLLNL